MIYIRFAGGLGNQLFQLAAGLEVQHKTNLPICIYIDALSKYHTKRKPLILEFIGSSKQICHCKPSWKTYLLKKRVGKLLFQFLFPFSINSKTILKFKQSLNFYLIDDYFQDINKIPNGMEKLKSIITQRMVADNKIKNIVKNVLNVTDQNQIAALHIRRGDYIDKRYISSFPSLCETYYENAIIKFGINIKKLIVFSDDPEIQFGFFSNYEIIRVSNLHLNDVQEFLLMSVFNNIVIANSTFSFLAAISNGGNEKNKVGPNSWIFNKTENAMWKMNLQSEKFRTEI
jgi:hypothetical protein